MPKVLFTLPAVVCILLGCLAQGCPAGDFPAFRPVDIDPDVCQKACYAVTLADVDGDEDSDIVAVTENRVLWYDNPTWQSHTIIENQTELDNVCIAPHDIDGDGKVDFALGAGWTRIGTIQWLSRGKSLDERWQVHSIGGEPWTHRMQFADVLGTGRPQLIVSPLNAAAGTAGVRLSAFEIPNRPRSDAWPRTVLDDRLNRMHNHWHADLNEDGTSETLAATQEGIHLVRRQSSGEFVGLRLANGMPGDSPEQSGAGEIKLGHLGNRRTFLATIEPMHGTSVVVYAAAEGPLEGQVLERRVIDDTLQQGHAVWTADVDRDGADEIVIGHREAGSGPIAGPGVYIYDAQNPDGSSWTKHVIDDGGMACEDLICADLNNDGWVDIVAGGRATKNVKLYWNEGE